MTSSPARRRWLLPVMLLLSVALVDACARSGPRGDRVDPNVISREQIVRHGFINAYLAVEALHANWLQSRGTNSFSTPSTIWVYLDNVKLGGIESLRALTLQQVRYIRHYNPVEATARWGLDHGAGVIFIATLPAPPPTGANPTTPPTGPPDTTTGFVISESGRSIPLVVSDADHAGVQRAVRSLAQDIGAVSGSAPSVARATGSASRVVIVGTIGKSPLIDSLLTRGLLDVSGVRGKWEAFARQVVQRPIPGVDEALVIAGSDKRGTIYGVYDLSSAIGVAPLYWWADVPIEKRARVVVSNARHTLGEPAVRYRGIFINDEAPALSRWTHEKFGGFNHGLYERVFELILRMKGNYLWPAMWGNAFADDDSLNAVLAEEYGIVMGTSHHEPLTRAQAEWRKYGKGEWNYEHNAPVLQEFWRGGIARMGTRENIVTVGMRGDGDEPMTESANIALLERIVTDQRGIIAKATGKPASATPQLWALYKEVQEYYDRGMRVPDDITLLFADDNWGNIRRLPELSQRNRPGGFGVYYHFDYVGGPRNYKWLNTNPIARVWEQMRVAHAYGANRIWIVNVGDIKPMEYPIQFFLDYAWNPEAYPVERLVEYPMQWATQQFGSTNAREIGDLVTAYLRYSSRRKPEMLDPDSYHLTNFREAEQVLAEWAALRDRAVALRAKIPQNQQDAYYQLVLHPIEANANQHELYITTGLNRLYALQGRASTNLLADKVKQLFERDAEISAFYNTKLAGGKWSHMMDQTHIGYTYWQEPPRNVMPRVDVIHMPVAAEMGVSVVEQNIPAPPPGARPFPPGVPPFGGRRPLLPPFNALTRPTWHVDVYNRGRTPFTYTARSSAAWLTISPASGTVTTEQRLAVSVDWTRAPVGVTTAPIVITGPNGATSEVTAVLHNDYGTRADGFSGFVQSEGFVSMEAEHFTSSTTSSAVSWLRIPGLGRTLSGMTATPPTAVSVTPGGSSPRLSYNVFLRDSGSVKMHAYFSPTLNVLGRATGVRYAMSVDDEPPVIVDIAADTTLRTWERMVGDNVRIMTTTHRVAGPGAHVVHFWFVDPGVVLQKLVLEGSGLPASYLGPPESVRRTGGTR
ncbi:MAG: glycosyl hydrolase 115 family protein [Gemmatimonadaceae bacterium]|nr:glycosyl hydrolase 115 family protein [Gemmatimonadaceae bacterium]